MKKPETILREYVRQLSDESLKFLYGRLSQRLGGDVAEALDTLSVSTEVDRWLASAKTCDDFYNMLDLVHEHIEKEVRRRQPDRGDR